MDAESKLTQTTLCFPVMGEPITSVLLGYKKRGFGAGKYTGFGGKVEPGETPLAAAVRELREETGLVTTHVDTSAAGLLTFRFPHRPAWSQQVHLIITRSWTGRMIESYEMRPRWFAVDGVPYDRMWSDGRHWLPHLLAGRFVRAEFTFAADNEAIDAFEIEAQPDL